MIRNVVLLASALITIGAIVPYIRDIIHGDTKPNIVSWMTWTLITCLTTVAELSAGDWKTAVLTGAAMMETAAVVVLGFRYGYVRYTRFDILCQIAALIGLTLWLAFDSPLTAVIASVAIDLVAAFPTFRHSWLSPHEETWPTFAMSGVGACIALFALNSYTLISVSFPLYMVILNISIAGTILVARRVRD